MSILRHIKRIPLFSTPLEAIAWGRAHNLSGYHTHMYNVKTGYMAGSNHSQASKSYAKIQAETGYHTMPDGTRMKNSEMNQEPAPRVPALQPIVNQPTINQPPPNIPVQRIIPPSTGNTSGGSSGGGGGGY